MLSIAFQVCFLRWRKISSLHLEAEDIQSNKKQVEGKMVKFVVFRKQ